MELSKALIGAFKTFKFEKGDEEQEKQAKELASKFKQEQEQSTGKRWSDVGHFENCYYVGYCRAGELATESVHEAGQYYNLNVDLTAGYMLGNSWATCH